MTNHTVLRFDTYDACEHAQEVLEAAGETITELPNNGRRPVSIRVWSEDEGE
jgi:hypothetical protein